MKNSRTSKGTFGAASSRSGAPHTRASLGNKPPAIVDGKRGGKIGYSSGTKYACSPEDGAKVKGG